LIWGKPKIATRLLSNFYIISITPFLGRELEILSALYSSLSSPISKSSDSQPGQPLRGFLDFGLAGVGGFPEVDVA
jgi:hypothetical protein